MPSTIVSKMRLGWFHIGHTRLTLGHLMSMIISNQNTQMQNVKPDADNKTLYTRVPSMKAQQKKYNIQVI